MEAMHHELSKRMLDSMYYVKDYKNPRHGDYLFKCVNHLNSYSVNILKPINKLRVSRRATKYLDEYFKKTGLRPNILARNAMMFSISNGDLYNELLINS